MKTDLLNLISQSLREVFEEYSSKGILTVYIWGSILTPDFNFQTSDIDTIALVEDEFPLEYESKIQKMLKEKHQDIHKIGFRIIYKSELDTNNPKSNLGTVGVPALLLLDLPTWKYVCGERFEQKDFKLKTPTYEQALKLRYDSTLQRWPDIDLIKTEEIQYFVKQILRIIHLEYLKRENLPYSIFSYSSIRKNETDMYHLKIIEICLDIKASNWNVTKFKDHISDFKKFLKTL